MTEPIRRLNERGRERFRAWLEGRGQGVPPREFWTIPRPAFPSTHRFHVRSRSTSGAMISALISSISWMASMSRSFRSMLGSGTGCPSIWLSRSAPWMDPGGGNYRSSLTICLSCDNYRIATGIWSELPGAWCRSTVPSPNTCWPAHSTCTVRS